MSDERNGSTEHSQAPGEPVDSPESARSSLDEVDVRDLLRRALDPVESDATTSLLDDVQRRLREETRGAFFADGWGLSSSPKQTYLVTSLVLLALLMAVWLMLAPLGVHRL